MMGKKEIYAKVLISIHIEWVVVVEVGREDSNLFEEGNTAHWRVLDEICNLLCQDCPFFNISAWSTHAVNRGSGQDL